MSKLVIATKNAGKVKEIKAIFSGLFDDILSLRDAGIDADVVEDGDTFLANAAKKATEISLLTDCPVLADDSGICVDCLGGAPGVYSARYSEEGTDEANNRKIVEETRRFHLNSAHVIMPARSYWPKAATCCTAAKANAAEFSWTRSAEKAVSDMILYSSCRNTA